jgi:hypothetical protein
MTKKQTQKFQDSYKSLKQSTADLVSISREKYNSVDNDDGLLLQIINKPITNAINQVKFDSVEERDIVEKALYLLRLRGSVIIDKYTKTPLDIEYLSIVDIDQNQLSKTFLRPKEVMTYEGEPIDEYLFLNMPCSTDFLIENIRGVSVPERVQRAYNIYLKSLVGGANIVDSMNQDVYIMQDLNDTLMSNGGEEAVKNRLEFIEAFRKLGILLMDGDDEYKTISKTLSGVENIVKSSSLHLCTVANIPYSVLFGEGKGGLSVTNESEQVAWHKQVKDEIVTPYITKICDYLGFKYEIVDYQHSEETRSKTLKDNVDSYLKLLENNIITERELREKLGII